eukprot:5934359-Amphidinium_carterae.1
MWTLTTAEWKNWTDFFSSLSLDALGEQTVFACASTEESPVDCEGVFCLDWLMAARQVQRTDTT